MTQRIGDYGETYPGETIAGELVYFNRFVKIGATLEEILMCDAGEDADGIAEYDYRKEFKDGTPRTGWEEGETLPVKFRGRGVIEAGEAIDLKEEIGPGANGVAMAVARTTVSSSPSQAEIESIRDQDINIKGKALTASTDAGDFIVATLKNMG